MRSGCSSSCSFPSPGLRRGARPRLTRARPGHANPQPRRADDLRIGAMAPRILGLHHVTATVDEAQADLDFCLDLLGLRLVKKTVNFDNHNVYHFYYGDRASARRARSGRRFPTRVTACASARRVRARSSRPRSRCRSDRSSSGAIGCADRACRHRRSSRRTSASRRSRFNDPSGLRFELIATDRDDSRAVDRRGRNRVPRSAACTASR